MKVEIEQGTDEWKELRRTKITATDASCILGLNPYKSSDELLRQKLEKIDEELNEAMERGRILEPKAREHFIKNTGIEVVPSVHVKDWAMCSTDGISEEKNIVLEIKCGKKAYSDASSRYANKRIPGYYYAQMQHILWVTCLDICYYMCFNGWFDITIPVNRDEEFIDRMIEKEYEFYLKMKEHIEV
jgi:putative phage-type endonuclease